MKLLQLSSPGSMAGTARHFEFRGAPSGQMSSPNMALQRTRRPRSPPHSLGALASLARLAAERPTVRPRLV